MKKRYEILDGLPAYGSMYISITDDNAPFFSEGFVVKFFKSDGSDWVANFKPGWTKYNNVFDYPEFNKIIVIASGLAYIMTPDEEKPLHIFGLTFDNVLQDTDNSLICSDSFSITLVDNSITEIWTSERISWDGIKDLELNGDTLTGQTYDPTNSIQPWGQFSMNVKTREITGGSYREFVIRNR